MVLQQRLQPLKITTHSEHTKTNKANITTTTIHQKNCRDYFLVYLGHNNSATATYGGHGAPPGHVCTGVIVPILAMVPVLTASTLHGARLKVLIVSIPLDKA